MKKIGTAPEKYLARLQAELRATDKRHQDATFTKETAEFIVKRLAKVYLVVFVVLLFVCLIAASDVTST